MTRRKRGAGSRRRRRREGLHGSVVTRRKYLHVVKFLVTSVSRAFIALFPKVLVVNYIYIYVCMYSVPGLILCFLAINFLIGKFFSDRESPFKRNVQCILIESRRDSNTIGTGLPHPVLISARIRPVFSAEARDLHSPDRRH